MKTKNNVKSNNKKMIKERKINYKKTAPKQIRKFSFCFL